MESHEKKSKKSSNYYLNLSIGFVLSILIVISAFEWKTYKSPEEILDVPPIVDTPPDLRVITIPEPKTEIQKPKPPETPELSDELKEVENDKIIEEAVKLTPIDIPTVVDVDDFILDDEIAPEPPFVTEAGVWAEFKHRLTFNEYIASKFRFPSRANGVSGTIYIQFIVDLDGSLTEIEVVKGLGKAWDDEAIRVVKNSPKWIPAKQNGKTVRLRMILPIKVGYLPVQ